MIKKFAHLFRRYRWPAIGMAIVVLWLMGYASLQFIYPDQADSERQLSQLEGEPVNPKSVLSQLSDDEDDAGNSSQNSAENNNDTAETSNQSQTDSRLCDQRKTSLKSWLNESLAAEEAKYEQTIKDITELNLLDSTDELEEALLGYEQAKKRLQNEYNLRLDNLDC